jgi:hypothetical protein
LILAQEFASLKFRFFRFFLLGIGLYAGPDKAEGDAGALVKDFNCGPAARASGLADPTGGQTRQSPVRKDMFADYKPKTS